MPMEQGFEDIMHFDSVYCTGGQPSHSSFCSGPKIMVVISCTVGKGISTGWMDAIFFPSAKIHLEILECVMCVSVLEKRC